MPNKLLQTNGPGRPKDLAKRSAILEAAKTLFLRHGYDGSSMDAIAAEAGVSKLTVYNHFTDKETLFSAAVKAKCEAQIPDLLFELPPTAPIATVLCNIARAFHTLINSCESIELHRVMINLSGQDAKLSNLFFEAGPQQLLDDMARLLGQASAAGKLKIEDPHTAADQFFCLVKGSANFCLLIGIEEALEGEAAELHVQQTVDMFMRAYKPD